MSILDLELGAKYRNVAEAAKARSTTQAEVRWRIQHAAGLIEIVLPTSVGLPQRRAKPKR